MVTHVPLLVCQAVLPVLQVKDVLGQIGDSLTLFVFPLFPCYYTVALEGEITTVGEYFLSSLSLSPFPTFSSESTCAVLINENHTSLLAVFFLKLLCEYPQVNPNVAS